MAWPCLLCRGKTRDNVAKLISDALSVVLLWCVHAYRLIHTGKLTHHAEDRSSWYEMCPPAVTDPPYSTFTLTCSPCSLLLQLVFALARSLLQSIVLVSFDLNGACNCLTCHKLAMNILSYNAMHMRHSRSCTVTSRSWARVYRA